MIEQQQQTDELAESAGVEDVQQAPDWSRFARVATLLDTADLDGQAPCNVPFYLELDGQVIDLDHVGHTGNRIYPLNIDLSRDVLVVEARIPVASIARGVVVIEDNGKRVVLHGKDVLTTPEAGWATDEDGDAVIVRFHVAELHAIHKGSQRPVRY